MAKYDATPKRGTGRPLKAVVLKAGPPPPSPDWSGRGEDPIPQPMPEAFCQAFLSHDRAIEAYRAAVPASKIKSASYWAKKWSIEYAARIDYLRRQAAEASIVEPSRLVRELSIIAMGDVVGPVLKLLPANSQWREKLESLTPAERSLISEINVKQTKDCDEVLQIRFYDKLAAIQMLGNHFGMFKQAKEDSPGGNMTQVVFNFDLGGAAQASKTIDVKAGKP